MRESAIFLCVFISLTASLAKAESLVTIVVRSAAVRNQPKSFATSIFKVQYGESLPVLGNENGWLKVSKAGKSGYLHSSAVTEKKLDFNSSPLTKPIGVSQSEIALAGKGFSEEAERSFAERDPTANFSAVASMQKLVIADTDIKQFIQSGSLMAAEPK